VSGHRNWQGVRRAGNGCRIAFVGKARSEKEPYFIAAATHAVGGALIPVPGGVLIRGEDKEIIGAVGATGDVSDNDQATALAGLVAAGLEADPS
jgi:uncharacterized protein GlcG (DUF336 family)